MKIFAKACKLDNFNNSSLILENLITQFIQKVDEGKITGINVREEERTNKNFMCDPEILENFLEACEQIKVKPRDVVESLIFDYIKQAEKDYGPIEL